MVAWAAVDAWAAAPERRRADVFLPLVVFPGERTAALEPSAAPLRDTIARYLPRVGAILCRGFRVAEDADFERFVALTAPREPRVAGRLWLWCAVPARGQRVVLVDRRELEGAVSPSVQRRWLGRARLDGFGDGLAAAALSLGGARDRRGTAVGEAARTPGGAGPDASGALDELDRYELEVALESCSCELSLEARDVLLLDTALIAHALRADGGIVLRRGPGASG